MNWRCLRVVGALCLVVMSFYSKSVWAEEDSFFIKKLMMPGPVIEGHAEYEQKCNSCHGSNQTMTQASLCLDCHEEVALDLQQSKGLHGRMADSKTRECRGCHSDHIGRQGDIVKMDKDSFDHKATDFDLKGKHVGLACVSCHMPDKKYRETPSQCFSCHEADDRHKGAFGEECQDCHSSSKWNKTKFDHSKTDFPLLGKHKEIQCNACHPDEKYKEIPKACVSCHAINDTHGGANGEKCDKCHRSSNWEKISFDHNKDTNFLLKGGHNGLACNACHQKSGFEERLEVSCISCHKNDDEHNGQNGRKCNSCHTVNFWSDIAFDHNLDTDFLLKGKHSDLSCESCHHSGIEGKELGASCIDCHRVDDVHQGQQGRQCNDCHNSKGWLNKVRFNHDLTKFPLVGMHAVSSCDNCHGSKQFSDTESSCVACHREDDVHKSALGLDCSSCHNPNDWQLWLFDHNSQSDFQLDGAHQDLSCSECHIKPVKLKVKQSSDCGSCHLNDDVHNRQFGRACERCHTSKSFKDIRVQ